MAANNDDNSGRLVDYMVTVAADAQSASSGAQLIGNEPLDLAILDRYPPEDFPDSPLPENVPMFAFPSGASVKKAPSPPRVVSFLIPRAGGRKHYFCSAITFWAQNSSSGGKFFSPRAFVIVSNFRFRELFERALMELFALAGCGADTNVPFWRYVRHFCTEAPLPPPGQTAIRILLGRTTMCFARPSDGDFPDPHCTITPLLKCLGPENAVKLLIAVALEKKVLLVSSRSSLLTQAGDAVRALLFPLSPQHDYMPLLPRPMLNVLHAETSFLMGMNADDLSGANLPADLVIAHLDQGIVTGVDSIPMPEHESRWLLEAFQALESNLHPCNDGTVDVFTLANFRSDAKTIFGAPINSSNGTGNGSWNVANTDISAANESTATPSAAASEASQTRGGPVREWYDRVVLPFASLDVPLEGGPACGVERALRAVGVAFWASIFQNYRRSLRAAASPGALPFDKNAFLSQCRPDAQPFVAEFLQTRILSAFVNERVSPKGSVHDIFLFDEAVQAVAALKAPLRRGFLPVALVSPRTSLRDVFDVQPINPDAEGLSRQNNNFSPLEVPPLNPPQEQQGHTMSSSSLQPSSEYVQVDESQSQEQVDNEDADSVASPSNNVLQPGRGEVMSVNPTNIDERSQSSSASSCSNSEDGTADDREADSNAGLSEDRSQESAFQEVTLTTVVQEGESQNVIDSEIEEESSQDSGDESEENDKGNGGSESDSHQDAVTSESHAEVTKESQIEGAERDADEDCDDEATRNSNSQASNSSEDEKAGEDDSDLGFEQDETPENAIAESENAVANDAVATLSDGEDVSDGSSDVSDEAVQAALEQDCSDGTHSAEPESQEVITEQRDIKVESDPLVEDCEQDHEHAAADMETSDSELEAKPGSPAGESEENAFQDEPTSQEEHGEPNDDQSAANGDGGDTASPYISTGNDTDQDMADTEEADCEQDEEKVPVINNDAEIKSEALPELQEVGAEHNADLRTVDDEKVDEEDVEQQDEDGAQSEQ